MATTEDLMQQANGLAAEIRASRHGREQGYGRDAAGIRALEQQLAAIWASIRAARVTEVDPAARDFHERRRPKWQ